ncbi:hypothetical protein Mal15_11100 [Stieleria maiorica]|uniref:Uncharacterized protein n=1 Tax=Stieleria maiorica TaxID=2795974 RepID=A0A5B9MBZ5_9BACT|nr:hypothetical protein Mal15_11100 [Stieleria maiorica]
MFGPSVDPGTTATAFQSLRQQISRCGVAT